MPNSAALQQQIFEISSEKDFRNVALEVFEHQYSNNKIYRQYCNYLRIETTQITDIQHIPFLPVSFFKSHNIYTESEKPEITFSSSGTSGDQTSFHYVADLQLYERSFMTAFELFYGKPSDYCILALLPSYLERSGSSLVYMADHLITKSKHTDSGFYLHELEDLYQKLQAQKANGQKTLLLGVTYALLDLVEQYPIHFPELIVMETGGMKGRRREMIREELHTVLCTGFGVQQIHSEYGMTELLSQAYSSGDGIFAPPPWMRIILRDTNDPFTFLKEGQSGGINIVDLANLHSCAFIEVQDIGRLHPENCFEVLGRFDNSQVRGCNLLVG